MSNTATQELTFVDLVEIKVSNEHRSRFKVSENFNNAHGFIFRLADFLFALFLSIFLIILIPVIWILNFFFDKGPLFYKQERVGKNGKLFNIIKFRSMVVDAEANGVQFTSENDHRITKVGSFLRKTRIDEIPQAINILRGDMSFIGPRPERPEFVNILTERDYRYSFRSTVRPGLTGWAQVKYKYTSTLDDGLVKMEYDLHYIKNRSLKMDAEVILRTAYIVIKRQGT